MTQILIDADELARLRSRSDMVAQLEAVVTRLSDEAETLRKIVNQFDTEADEVADLAVERWRTIQTLEARCASLQRQVLDLAVQP